MGYQLKVWIKCVQCPWAPPNSCLSLAFLQDFPTSFPITVVVLNSIFCFFKPVGPWISTWILFAILDVYLGTAFRLKVVWIGSSPVVLLPSIKPSLQFLFVWVTFKCLQIVAFYSQHSIFMRFPFHMHKFNQPQIENVKKKNPRMFQNAKLEIARQWQLFT